MDRRSFLKKGALGASGLAAGSAGCSPLITGAQPGGQPGGIPTDLAQYLNSVDTATRRLDHWRFSASFPDSPADPVLLDDLGPKAVRTLYVTGMFGDLPVERQVHPAVQERLWAAQPVMDETVTRTMALLADRTREEHDLLRRRLRERPDLVPRLIEVVDEQAGLAGLSDARRKQFRSQVEHVAWRLENQPPALMIGEYVDKVRKVSASDVEDAAYQRWLTARVGEAVFWQEEQSRRERRISGGLRTMGIGVIILGASGALLAIASGSGAVGVGLVGATVGSIFILVGLIRLLIGLGTPREAR